MAICFFWFYFFLYILWVPHAILSFIFLILDKKLFSHRRKKWVKLNIVSLLSDRKIKISTFLHNFQFFCQENLKYSIVLCTMYSVHVCKNTSKPCQRTGSQFTHSTIWKSANFHFILTFSHGLGWINHATHPPLS